MATGDMLQEMVASRVTYNERSTTASSLLHSFLHPVFLSNQPAQCATLTPSASQTLKKSHWKSLAKTDRCTDPKCGVRFNLLVKKRNCCMCGEVYCHKCTRFRRKLSFDAMPDPLFGVFCHVCHSCFDIVFDDTGCSFDWTDIFSDCRVRERLSVRQKEEDSFIDSLLMPIPALKTSVKMKKKRVLLEIDRLVRGFTGSSKWMRGIITIPSWQKSPNWTEPGHSHQCFHCHNSFKMTLQKMITKKINCRVCGQVYCSNCTKEEIIIFLLNSRSTSAKWAINGKTGTPVTAPYTCAVLPVCVTCVKELEEILIDEIEAAEDNIDYKKVGFMESLVHLQSSLYNMKARIEVWLPLYQKLVDSMEISSFTMEQSKVPINDLIRSQFNLSDEFSQMSIESQKIHKLEPCTPTQLKVFKNMIIVTYRFYSDHLYLFHVARCRLAEKMHVQEASLDQILKSKLTLE